MTLTERLISTTLRNLSPLMFIAAVRAGIWTAEYGRYHGWFATNFGG